MWSNVASRYKADSHEQQNVEHHFRANKLRVICITDGRTEARDGQTEGPATEAQG